MLTALQLINVMKRTRKPLSELAKEMKKYPQKLVNVRVKDKYHVTENEKVKEAIQEVEKDMAGNGRVLVRPSGTEPLVRVMVEAPTMEACDEYVERIAKVVEEEMGLIE